MAACERSDWEVPERGGGGSILLKWGRDPEGAEFCVDHSSSRGVIPLRFICDPFGSSSSDDRKPTFSDDGGWVRPGRDCCIGRHQCTSSVVDPVKSDAHGQLAKRVLHVFIDSWILRDHALVPQVARFDHDVIAHLVEDCLGSFLPDESHAPQYARRQESSLISCDAEAKVSCWRLED